MQDKPALRYIASLFLLLTPLILGGCAEGDLGRHSPSYVSKTVFGALNKARQFVDAEDYDLPLTAAEDALRRRAKDLYSIRHVGIISQAIPARSGDGYSVVASIITDLKVERQRFARFVMAARKVMRIDDLRRERLAGLDALMARRQSVVATERRARNNWLIREGVRTMRERVEEYREVIMRLPVEYPHVRLRELRAVHEDFQEDVFQFHSEIDERAHMQLGRGARSSYK